MIEYKLVRNENKSSRYPWVIIKSYPGFFQYYFCTEKQKKKYTNLAELYKEAFKND